MKTDINDLFKINNQWYNYLLMPSFYNEIKRLIKESIPDAIIEIKDQWVIAIITQLLLNQSYLII